MSNLRRISDFLRGKRALSGCIAFFVLGCFLMVLSSCAPGPGQTFTLTEDGQPVSTIVIAEDADKSARFASLELQSHIKKITGAELPIVKDNESVKGPVILVGESFFTREVGLRNSDFKSQEYLIRFVSPDVLILMGKDENDKGEIIYDYISDLSGALRTWPLSYDYETGTMYAVYDFLRDYCGVMWLNPTDYGTVLPEEKTLRVTGGEVRREPFMDYRGAAADHRAESYNHAGGHWRAGSKGANDFNALAYGKNSGVFKNEHQNSLARRAQNRLFLLRMKNGGENSHCNHSLYNYYDRFLEVTWTEALKKVDTPEEKEKIMERKKNLFEGDRPELFAKGYEGQPPQLCYSSQATVEQVIKDARNYFDQGGYTKTMRGVGSPGFQWGKRFFAIEPMDNASFCKCEKCSVQYEPERKDERSQHSTYWFRFINKVARELKKSHPDKKISTLAYGSREGLPTGIKLEDNVVVHFCLSGNRMPYSPALNLQIERLREWERKEDVPMYLWLYNTFPVEIANNGKFYCFPGFFAHEVKKQFDLFKELNIRGIFHCGFNGEVENYINFRLMDNPDIDIESLLEEYFSQYGEAGKPLREMYELIEKRYCNHANYPKGPNGEPFNGHQNVKVAWEYLGDEETMGLLQKYMDEAERAAVTESEKVRVKLWEYAVWSYMKTGREKYVERTTAPLPDISVPKVAESGGDTDKVNWNNAASLGEKWFKRGGNEPSSLKLGGRICHDGNYLYMELVDYSNPKKLVVSPQIACYDDWEVFIALQTGQPFRQYLIGPTAMAAALSYGEINWRQGVNSAEYGGEENFGLKVTSDTSGDKWVTRLSFPLDTMSDRPVKPGTTIYLNIIRVINPALAGIPRYGLDTWISYTTVKDPDRMGKITLLP